MTVSPLKWHGGKSPIATKIRKLFPSHTRYCEPYFGGGSVLFAGSGENVSEFANDVNGELMNFWTVLRDYPTEFMKLASLTPFSSETFENACEAAPISTLGRALKFLIINRQSRQGLGKSFATPTSRLRRGMNENVSAWLSAVDGLPEVVERLRRIEIRNERALDMITALDSPDTLFYCDPPYVHETRTATKAYEYEMDDRDHLDLLAVLGAIRGKFILSGYNNPMYDCWYEALKTWKNVRRVELDVPNHSSGAAIKERKLECLWIKE